MDEETRRELAAAADVVEHGPDRLKALIVTASRQGARPSDIHRAVYPAYTYEYIRQLIAADKRARREDGQAA